MGRAGRRAPGLDFSQILAFYYPGTNQQDIGNPVLRVQLSATPSGDMRVDSTTPGDAVTVKDSTRATT